MLLASTDGAGWTVETADLWLTGRHRGNKRVSADPLGDGPQLIVSRYGRVVAYCAGEGDLAALGVDLSRMCRDSEVVTPRVAGSRLPAYCGS